jgi:hypothetical protein
MRAELSRDILRHSRHNRAMPRWGATTGRKEEKSTGRLQGAYYAHAKPAKSMDRDDFIKRQRALAEFGEFALRCEDLQEILSEACRLIADALGTDFGKVVEIERDRRTALIRAGVGWSDGIVGNPPSIE